MKIVLTVERYFPSIGGAERVVQRIAEHLARVGHDVVVVTSGDRATSRIEEVQVERFPLRGNFATGITGDADEPLQFVRALAPDAILSYAAQTWTADVFSEMLRESDRPALLFAPCGFSALRNPAYERYFDRMRALLRQYDALIFHSASYQDWQFAVEAGAARLLVIPNGADDPTNACGRSSTAHPRRKRVVTVGSHVRSKGHADFVKAVRMLGRNLPVEGIIVAPQRLGLDALRGCQLACSLRSVVTSVACLDGREPTAATDAIASADLFLLPSTVECSPLVILEAMAAGVPWVSYDVGNVREFAGGFVANSFQELVSLAEDVLAGHHPSLGLAGKEAWAKRHRWSEILPKYESVLTETVRLRQPASAG